MTRDGWRNSEDGTDRAAPGTSFTLPLTRHIHVSSCAFDLTIAISGEALVARRLRMQAA